MSKIVKIIGENELTVNQIECVIQLIDRGIKRYDELGLRKSGKYSVRSALIAMEKLQYSLNNYNESK